MGQSRVGHDFTLVCPVALQAGAAGPLCNYQGASSTEQLGRHIRNQSLACSCLPGSLREASVSAHKRLYGECLQKGYLSSKKSHTMLRAGVSALRLLCSRSQLHQYRTGLIAAKQVDRLTGDEDTVW